jgi:hypothetical protein
MHDMERGLFCCGPPSISLLWPSGSRAAHAIGDLRHTTHGRLNRCSETRVALDDYYAPHNEPAAGLLGWAPRWARREHGSGPSDLRAAAASTAPCPAGALPLAGAALPLEYDCRSSGHPPGARHARCGRWPQAPRGAGVPRRSQRAPRGAAASPRAGRGAPRPARCAHIRRRPPHANRWQLYAFSLAARTGLAEVLRSGSGSSQPRRPARPAPAQLT